VIKIGFINQGGVMKRNIIFFVFSILVISGVFAQSRGVEIEAVVGPNVTVGKQWAVFIAIDRYREWGSLDNPVRDAREIQQILKEHYIIDAWRELYNENASAEGIRTLFNQLRQEVGINDSVFVFHAGHGYKDNDTDKGAWIPFDAGRSPLRKEGWIAHDEIRTYLDRLQAKHVFLISDSCFSGDLLANPRSSALPRFDNDYFRRAYSFVSRQIITSGASEEVPDSSEFARRLKDALIRAEGACIDPLRLFEFIRNVQTTQPRYGIMPASLHQQDGSFLFFRNQVVTTVPNQPPVPVGKIPLDSNAMREQFNGDWISSDTRLQINGNRIIQYFRNSAGTWYQVTPEVQFFLYGRNNLVYIWLNKGGVWSETQVFSLSSINTNTLDLVWNRHVNNIIDNADNDVWNANGHKILHRAGSTPNIQTSPLSQSTNQTIPAQFHGNWVGEINVAGRNMTANVRLTISANRVIQYFQNDDGSWDEVVPDNSSFSFDRYNMVYVWLDTGGIWTETQVFSLSFVNTRNLNVVWSRHVNNYYSDEPFDEAWHIGGEGTLIRQ